MDANEKCFERLRIQSRSVSAIDSGEFRFEIIVALVPGVELENGGRLGKFVPITGGKK